MIKLLHHSAQCATIQVSQLELQLLMALVKEGRNSLGCHNDFGISMDGFLVSTNNLVEHGRRQVLAFEMRTDAANGTDSAVL